MILEKINSPADLKTLSLKELPNLATEIRRKIIDDVSHTGGHLASNLGVVELTIMMHYVFNSPKDKFVFDVGHQTYTHKILTSRKDKMRSIRKKGGLSGFPKRSESEHDIAETGHASTSISFGLGLEIARKIQNEDSLVVSLIGDGALTGGLALEALNYGGHIPNNLIVILNNNEMSIGNNIGGMSKYLNQKITEPSTRLLAESIESFASKLPFGEHARDWLQRFEASVKAFIAPGIIFRELGFKYIGPVNGHDIDDLYQNLTFAKTVNAPLVVQVNTVKGKGYEPSESNPSRYHGVGKFDISTGKSVPKKGKTFSALFGESLCKIADEDERVVAITAAMTEGTGLSSFAEKFKERFFDVGIAEAHATTFASGMAAGGMKPVCAIYSTFLQRAYDSIIHDTALMSLPVIFAIDRAGLVPEDGETHQGIFDLAFLRIIPKMSIFAPMGEEDFLPTLRRAFSLNTPVVIRYPKSVVENLDECLLKGDITENIRLVKEGSDGIVITFGTTAIDVYEAVKESNLNLSVCVLTRVIPIDRDGLLPLIKKHKNILVVEEGVVNGGVGSAVGEIVLEEGLLCRLKTIGVPNTFLQTASREELLQECGLDKDSLVRAFNDFFNG